MTRSLYLEPEAEAELEQAADRYEESVPGLGVEFLSEMRERTRDVLNTPLAFRRTEAWRASSAHMPLADFRIS